MGCCPKSNSREIITGSSRKVELALGFGAFVIYSQLMQTLIASLVLEIPAASPETSNRHFVHKLTVETDPSDVKADLDNGASGFVVIDARSADNYRKAHVPGAKSLPHGTIDADTTADLSKDILLVVYCWSPACNGAAKACAKLSALGFRVKEMIGGIEYWRKEGYPVDGTEAG